MSKCWQNFPNNYFFRFFSVLPSGEVIVQSELDRESRDIHYLTFTAIDGGGKVTSTTGEITVTDINDNSPTFVCQRSLEIAF